MANYRGRGRSARAPAGTAVSDAALSDAALSGSTGSTGSSTAGFYAGDAGEPACWAAIVCERCGGVLGADHTPFCEGSHDA